MGPIRTAHQGPIRGQPIRGTYWVLDPFPRNGHRHRLGGADVGDVEVAEFLDPGGGVVGQAEQDGVADRAWAGGARFGEQRFDLVPAQVPQFRRRGALLADREDLGEVVEVVGLLDGGVAAERLATADSTAGPSCAGRS